MLTRRTRLGEFLDKVSSICVCGRRIGQETHGLNDAVKTEELEWMMINQGRGKTYEEALSEEERSEKGATETRFGVSTER